MLSALSDNIAQLRSLHDLGAGLPSVGESSFEQIVDSTITRSTRSVNGIVLLLSADLESQAAMVARALCEDLVVAHWLVLHADDPGWLVDRFFDHGAAMAASRDRRGHDHGWPGPAAGQPPAAAMDLVSRLRQPARVGGYGEHATTDWWPFEKSGERLDAETVVKRLMSSERFAHRLRDGDQNLLAWYRIAQRWASQQLHHTAAALNPVPRGEGLGSPVPYPPEFVSHHALMLAYWAYANQVALVIELCELPLAEEFQRLSSSTAEVFRDSQERLTRKPTPVAIGRSSEVLDERDLGSRPSQRDLPTQPGGLA